MTSSARSNPQPQPLADKTARESVIRDLYALVAFFVANPDFPLPSYMLVQCRATAEQVAQLAAEHSSHGVYRLEGTKMPITIVAVTPSEDRPL